MTSYTLRSRSVGAQPSESELEPEAQHPSIGIVVDSQMDIGPDIGTVSGLTDSSLTIPSPGVTLTKEQMQARIDTIMAKKAEAHLSRQLALMEQEEQDGFPLADTSPMTLSHWRRSSRLPSSEEILEKKLENNRKVEARLNVVEVDLYTAETYAKCVIFIAQCLQAFQQKPATYDTAKGQILFAKAFKRGDVVIKWQTHEEAVGLDNITWETYVTWLRDDVWPPHLRIHDGFLKYRSVRQREGQTVAQLIAYIRSIEDILPSQKSSMRMNTLLGALKPTLREEIIKHNSSVTTRELLEPLAQKLEAIDNNYNRTKANGRREAPSRPTRDSDATSGWNVWKSDSGND